MSIVQLLFWKKIEMYQRYYEAMIGLRYTKSRASNNFVSFISVIAMLGIALGVAALVVVLSVMNGFQQELRERILGVVSHVQIQGYGKPIPDWSSLDAQVRSVVAIDASAPYSLIQGLLSKDGTVRGVMIRGVIPELEKTVSSLPDQIVEGHIESLVGGNFNIILGSELAAMLRVEIGDDLLLMIPKGQVTPAGVIPRLKMFQVAGIFEAGMYDYDAGLALINIKDSQTLTRSKNAVDGLRIKIRDLFLAPSVSEELASRIDDPNLLVSDWTQSHANFFRAVQIEKKVMFIILLLVVAVAAFNIVSTLVMAVADKRSDIAILRTIGASPRGVMLIFMIQGALIGVIGTIVGTTLGVVVATNIDTIVPFIETLLGMDLLSKDIYYISDLPSDLHINDVMIVVGVSLFLSVTATLYPSWKASTLRPAEALRYE